MSENKQEKIVFVHRETGLRVNVFVTEREIVTEAGDQCIPATTDDVHQLLAIKVLTRHGTTTELTRESFAW